ncbi:MAG: hypothetical protein WC263_04660 [Candidatus Micrarchaeia archaeon]|jgi:hypothetical protein
MTTLIVPKKPATADYFSFRSQSLTAQDYFKFRTTFVGGVRFQGMGGKTKRLLRLHTAVTREEAAAAKALKDAIDSGGSRGFFSLKRALCEKLMGETNPEVRAVGKLVLDNAETAVLGGSSGFGKELLIGAARLGIGGMKK